jgi:tetratricopeptide (TPR) repeat protein
VGPRRQILRALAALILLLGARPGACAGSPPPEAAQDDSLVRLGDAAAARFDPEGALRFYLKASLERPKDPTVLLKIAKEYSDSTVTMTDTAESARRIEKALRYSQRAAELDPGSAVAVLSQAVCYGKLADFCDGRRKFEYARLVKEYADRALAMDPNYAYAHDVLGQWECEVATLGTAKRLLASLIFGDLPPASTEESVRQLEWAVRLEPDIATHRLALGFAYLANGQTAKARRSFEYVISMPTKEIYDADCREQAQRAIARL